MGKQSFIIRPFKNVDLEKISQLRKSFSDDSARRSCEVDYYRWKFLSNPVDEAILYVAEDESNQNIIGMVSITPKPLYICGNYEKGAELGDCFVNPAYQGQGIFSALLNITRQVAIERGVRFIYGTPNQMALPGEKKAGYDIVPFAQVANLVLPINISRILQRIYPSIKILKSFNKLIDLCFQIYSFTVRKPNHLDQTVTIYEQSFFPDEIYSLSEKLSNQYDYVLHRTQKYLIWRYISNPDTYPILIAKKSNHIVGCVVLKEGFWQGLHVGYIADTICDPSESGAFSNLIYNALEYFNHKSVDMVATWVVKDSAYYKTLQQYGFRKYKDVPIICYKNDLGKHVINSSGKWHFTMADSDNI